MVGGGAFGAFAAHIAVGQEHSLFGVVQLHNRALGDEIVLPQRAVDADGQRLVFRRMGGVIVVKVHIKRGEIPHVGGAHSADELLGGDSLALGAQHHRRAVRIVRADMPAFGAAHPVKTGPDVGLNVAEQVAQVNVPVCVGERRGDKNAAGGGGHKADSTAIREICKKGLFRRKIPA